LPTFMNNPQYKLEIRPSIDRGNKQEAILRIALSSSNRKLPLDIKLMRDGKRKIE
jgi:hypothetical protein